MTGRHVGAPTPRVEGREKVTGAARYAAEHAPPGLHHAEIVPATAAAGRVTAIDTTVARAVPGVVGVLDHTNAPKLTAVKIFPLGPAGEGFMPLQDRTVRYPGQAVALVVAASAEVARHAAGLVRVTYEAEPPRVMDVLVEAGDGGEAQPAALRKVNDATRGDVDRGLAEADVTVEATFDTPAYVHNALELAATVAEWDEADGVRLTLHDSTQWVLGCRRTVADALGLPLDRVRVVCPFTGGGFGSKCFTWHHTILAAVAARQFKVPVRVVLSRAQTHRAFGSRPQARQTIAVGAKRDGTLTAVRHHAVTQTSTHDVFVRPAGEVSEVLYACPHLETRHRVLPVHVCTPTNMRAPAESYGSFALESALDELAERLVLDPLALRQKNLPAAHPDGLPWSSCGLGECYRLGAKAFGWERRPLTPGTLWEGDERVGWGMAAAAYGGYRSQAAARLILRADGTVEVATASHEIGSGTMTLAAQLAADELAVPLNRVRVRLGDTDLPAAPVHGASRTAASVGPAVQATARALRTRIVAAAVTTAGSPLHGIAAEYATVSEGAVWAAGREPLPFDRLLRLAGLAELVAEERAGPPELGDKEWQTLASGINTIRQPKSNKQAIYAFGAHFVEVRVRPARGEVRVSRVVSRFAAGRILNPTGAQSQVLGGIVFGLGMALREAVVIDPATGRPVSSSPTDYLLPAADDVPDDLDLGFVPEADGSNEVGAKGVGELGLVGFAAAVANAVWHANGRRVRSLPITPEKLLDTSVE